MEKILTFICIIGVVHATTSSLGYNYQSNEKRQEVPIHEPADHEDGVEKQFYYFNAPEEQQQQQTQQQIVHVNPPVQTKKTQQIVFIEPPQQQQQQQHHTAPVQNVGHNVVEDKTQIYVLTKDVPRRSSHVQVQTLPQATVSYHHSKPEVHFIKYSTPAEADRIQQSIIQKYGGNPSEVVHLGAGSIVSHHGSKNFKLLNSPSLPSREYLAPVENSLPSGVDVVAGSSYLPPFLRNYDDAHEAFAPFPKP